ncbi:MAG: SDR family NAD(P)-dependent oxidoreductase [Gammaproteobacteria bacterium]|nr:SDR family NAD(P)-dependent oxidoreductase [Gammaproteobacteria bacterium]
MNDRVCLVTGATSGIGHAAARALVREKLTLVIHGRNAERLESARAALRGAGPADVQTIRADFASLDEVREMAVEFRQRFNRLDILFNNAGLLTDERRTGIDGFELTFTVNHLAPMLLTWSLLPLLRNAAPARILFNSSSALGDARLDIDDLQGERWHSGWSAYANTKLANMLMSSLLAERLAGDGIVCNSFCPGLIDTRLLKDNREFSPRMLEHIKKRVRTPEDGALTAVYLATAPEAAKISGAFFLKSQGAGRQPVHIHWDRDLAVRLREETARILKPWLGDQAGSAADSA